MKRPSIFACIAATALTGAILGSAPAWAAFNYDLLDWQKMNLIGYDGSKHVWKGTNGPDVFLGSPDSGKTKVLGGAGDDIFVLANQLVEKIQGGPGADLIVVGQESSDGLYPDVILDFDPSEGDKIDLSMIDATTKMQGKQSFRYIGEKAEFEGPTGYAAAGQLRFWNGYLIGTTNGSWLDDTNDLSDCQIVVKLNGVDHLDASSLILGSNPAALEKKKNALKKIKKKVKKLKKSKKKA